MKRFVVVLLAAFAVLSAAEPLAQRLEAYARAWVPVGEEVRELSAAVRQEFPEAWFEVDDAGRVASVHRAQSGDLVRFDFTRLDFLRDEIGRTTAAWVPEVNGLAKTVKTTRGYEDSLFGERVREFKYMVGYLVQVAGIIRGTDPSFLAPGYGELGDAYDLRAWGDWYDATLELAKWKVDRALGDFERRYGPQSDKLNFLELALVNLAPPFRGSMAGPSCWEPVFRLAPVCYDMTGNGFAKTAQVGFNYYFLDGRPLDFMGWLNHAGVSFVVADVTSDRIYRLDFGRLFFGGMLHLGRYQVGAVADPGAGDWRFITTFNFQAIPGIF